GSHPFELRLFEIRSDPDIVQGNNHEQALSWLDAVTQLDRFATDHAAYWRVDLGVAEIELCGVHLGAGLLEVSCGGLGLGTCIGNLLWSDAGGFDLRFPLDDEAARFGDPLLSRNDRSPVSLDCLGGGRGFRFAGIIIGP